MNAPPATALEQRISQVGDDLVRCFRDVLEALPDPAYRPHQLAEQLGLNRDISGRVLSATRASDPLTAAHVIPGPDPLRKVLRAARDQRVSGPLLDEAELAVRAFEQLIREEAGNRPALDAIISSLQPQARARFELNARQRIFRGTTLLKGVLAERWLHTAFVHPSADDGEHCDVAHAYGTLGLCRLRPAGPVKFSYRQFSTAERPWRTLDGHAPDACDGTELDRFCTLPPAALDVTHTDEGAVYTLAGDEVGPQSARDKLLAEIRPRAMARQAAARPRNLKSLFVAPSVPVRELVFDMLLHEDVYPAAQPELIVFDTTVEGMASVNDPARDADRLPVTETIAVLGRGRDAFALPEVPKYAELLDHVTTRLGWDLDAFRGFRCRIQYPMHGSQACMAFEA